MMAITRVTCNFFLTTTVFEFECSPAAHNYDETFKTAYVCVSAVSPFPPLLLSKGKVLEESSNEVQRVSAAFIRGV